MKNNCDVRERCRTSHPRKYKSLIKVSCTNVTPQLSNSSSPNCSAMIIRISHAEYFEIISMIFIELNVWRLEFMNNTRHCVNMHVFVVFVSNFIRRTGWSTIKSYLKCYYCYFVLQCSSCKRTECSSGPHSVRHCFLVRSIRRHSAEVCVIDVATCV